VCDQRFNFPQYRLRSHLLGASFSKRLKSRQGGFYVVRLTEAQEFSFATNVSPPCRMDRLVVNKQGTRHKAHLIVCKELRTVHRFLRSHLKHVMNYIDKSTS
jgi:hypothetical protein